MGHFGHLAKVYGIVSHRLSPHELQPLGGLLKDGIPNTVRRIRSQIFIVLPPFVLGYALYDWGEREHTRLERKNPADYANDV